MSGAVVVLAAVGKTLAVVAAGGVTAEGSVAGDDAAGTDVAAVDAAGGGTTTERGDGPASVVIVAERGAEPVVMLGATVVTGTGTDRACDAGNDGRTARTGSVPRPARTDAVGGPR
jgi:hypothetical protein